MNRKAIALAPVVFAILLGCSGGDSSPKAEKAAGNVTAKATADCCQCSTAGTPTTPSTPVACTTGTTDQAQCDKACGTNIGGIINGACKDGVRCQ